MATNSKPTSSILSVQFLDTEVAPREVSFKKRMTWAFIFFPIMHLVGWLDDADLQGSNSKHLASLNLWHKALGSSSYSKLIVSRLACVIKKHGHETQLIILASVAD